MADLLAAGGACWRCQLRHQRPLPPDGAYEDEAAAVAAGCTFQKPTDSDSGPCRLCLGLLEEPMASGDAMAEEVAAQMAKEGRANDAFLLTVSTPVCMLLRDTAACLELAAAAGASLDLRARLAEVEEAKSVWKRLQRRRFASVLRLPFFNTRVGEGTGVEVFPLSVDVAFAAESDSAECDAVLRRLAGAPSRQRRKGMALHGWAEFTLAGSLTVLAATPAERLRELLKWPPPGAAALLPTPTLHCGPVLIAGRYTKLSRHLSQTPWFVDGERRMEGSVEELISGPVLVALGGDSATFSASGREDKDVRTLGRGRPFLLEVGELRQPLRLREPRCLPAIRREIAAGAAGKVAVRDLQVVSKAEAKRLKEGEEEKRKNYEALCWCEAELSEEDLQRINDVRELEIEQDTPIRVLHRRTAMTRRRVIHELRARLEDAQHLRLSLSTQAGTYVKEFVNGDLGRTRPSLGSIVGKEFDILLLDVTEVCFDWPPALPDDEEEEAVAEVA